ncbi:MAG TPA: cache domain-containing protein, partial [Rhodopila sp.]|nr:cache domain-containing protein [Rhodopila sp.]
MRVLRGSIDVKLLVLGIGMMVGCLGVVGAVADYVLTQRLTERETAVLDRGVNLLDRYLLSKGTPSIQNGHLMIGATIVDGNDALVDELSSLMDGAGIGIYNGDIRVATSARKLDGTRAVGQRMDPVPRETIYGRGQRYTGRIQVGGVQFFSTLLPIRDSAGHVIGTLAGGSAMTARDKTIAAIFWDCTMTSLPVVAVAAFLLLLFTRRITRPLVRMTGQMADIAGGKLTTVVDMAGRH